MSKVKQTLENKRDAGKDQSKKPKPERNQYDFVMQNGEREFRLV